MVLEDRPCLIDADIWIAFFDKTDAQHSLAQEFLQYIIDRRYLMILSAFVVQEVLTVLLYKNKLDIAERFISFIHKEEALAFVFLDESLLKGSVQYMQTHQFRPKMSFNDWSLLFLAENANLELFTLDKQLGHAYQRFNKK